MAYDALIYKIYNLSNIGYILNTENEEGYCRYVSSGLFGKEFSDEMVFEHNYVNKKALFCAQLDTYLNKDMNKKEFEEFSKEITKLRRDLFGMSKHENRGRDKDDYVALNHRFEELELPYEEQKNGDMYRLIKKDV